MHRLILLAKCAAFCCSLAACTSDTFQRVEGLSPGAGNAIAANTAMQMVDPWQYGVQDTDLSVPADRGAQDAAAAAAPAAAGGGSYSATGGATAN